MRTIMRFSLSTALLSMLCMLTTKAQSTQISGQINDYFQVLTIDYCASSLSLNSTSGLQPGDRVLLIQMQGATIQEDNNNNFGNIIDLGSCGLHELTTVQSVSDNTITLEYALLHNYELNANVQLIRVPVYENASVVAPLTPLPWNGTQGGVLALIVENTLSLSANITADGMGFIGGNPFIDSGNNCTWLINQNDYFYGINNWRGARKGEGIASFISGKEAGRGAQANGGGGANDHNAGGGGGAQITSGGQGGINDEPATFGCDGDFPGLGGKVPPLTQNRIFMGGGGGAGHENNNNATAGGHGGGILFIKANTINGNGFSISARGLSAEDTSGDGAGGGGAAGSIVLEVDNIINPDQLNIHLQGGHGGQINNLNQDRCYGPGGGGSGGRLLTTAPGLNPILTGGNAGLSFNSSDGGCPDGTNGAASGSFGVSQTLDSIPAGNQLNLPPQITDQITSIDACFDDPLLITLPYTGNNLSFQWQWNDGNGFTDLPEGGNYSGTQTDSLQINAADLISTTYTYRLLLLSDCFETVFSDPIQINIQESPIPDFSFSAVGLSVQFSNLSQFADSFLWDFGNSQNSTQESPTHLYEQEGNYTVTLFAINDCDTIPFQLEIELFSSPTADFSASAQSGCAPLTVSFENLSTGSNSTYNWSFPGGNPATSSDPSPVVTYNTPGIFDVSLQVSNPAGEDMVLLQNYIEVNTVPQSDFSFTTNTQLATFTNLSQGADSYFWDFGDGETSTLENPAHTFPMQGTYVVTLVAFNECGSTSSIQTVVIGQVPQSAFTVITPNGCSPHTAVFQDLSTGVFDTYFWEFPGGVPATSDEPDPIVVYNNPGTYDVKLTVSGPLGTDVQEIVEAVEVVPAPIPDFNYVINGNEVSFNNLSVNATSYTWDFGDGNMSAEINPMHTYAMPGVYTVSLNAQAPFCGTVLTQNIQIGTTSNQEVWTNNLQLYPNPAGEIIYLYLEGNQQPLRCVVYDLVGRKKKDFSFTKRFELSLNDWPAGVYFIRTDTDQQFSFVKY